LALPVPLPGVCVVHVRFYALLAPILHRDDLLRRRDACFVIETAIYLVWYGLLVLATVWISVRSGFDLKSPAARLHFFYRVNIIIASLFAIVGWCGLYLWLAMPRPLVRFVCFWGVSHIFWCVISFGRSFIRARFKLMNGEVPAYMESFFRGLPVILFAAPIATAIGEVIYYMMIVVMTLITSTIFFDLIWSRVVSMTLFLH